MRETPLASWKRLTVASYNVHRFVGIDGRRSTSRVGKVIRELGADIIALQEVESSPRALGGEDPLHRLAAAEGLRVIAGPTLSRREGDYGNALLTRLPAVAVRRLDLSVPGREPRGALLVDLSADAHHLRVVATHLGLQVRERLIQIRRLLDAIPAKENGPLVLLGDFNEWRPASAVRRLLRERFGRAPAVRTFPARRPLLALDRILVKPITALVELDAHRTPLSRVASDHLPVRAVIDVAPCTRAIGDNRVRSVV